MRESHDFLQRITGGQRVQQVLVDLIRRFFIGWVLASHHTDPTNEPTFAPCGLLSSNWHRSIAASSRFAPRIHHIDIERYDFHRPLDDLLCQLGFDTDHKTSLKKKPNFLFTTSSLSISCFHAGSAMSLPMKKWHLLTVSPIRPLYINGQGLNNSVYIDKCAIGQAFSRIGGEM